jgi:phage tail sheath protein FI
MVSSGKSPFHDTRANILCLSAAANLDDTRMAAVYRAAGAWCAATRAFLIVDMPPASRVSTPQAAKAWLATKPVAGSESCAAVYYPRLKLAAQNREVGASGAMAGLYATTDKTRGVWKAPAGVGAALRAVVPVRALRDADVALLNSVAINSLRSMPSGVVSWGARTLAGADGSGSEWKYIPVRRLGDHIELSVSEGLQWTSMEANQPRLWQSVVSAVTSFLTSLWQQGALAGITTKDAFYVRCDATTTTQADIDQGRCNLELGFAPTRPAEFVILRISMATAGNCQ